MKGFIKLMPAALGLLTLASCSNEDSFVSDSIAGKTTMIVTTEDDATTRAYADKDLVFTWGVNDQIRAYDKNMQAYDNYKYNVDAAKFVVDNDPQYVDNADYGYAIFGEDISYNGWQQDGTTGVLTALVNIPSSIDYKEAYSKYKAALPMWGVANNAGDHLEVNLKYLTGIAIMQFSNGKQSGVQKVRVRSLKWKAGADDGDKAAVRALQQGDNITALGTACEENTALPLSGWFNARMEINEDATVDSLKYGKMEKLVNGPLLPYKAANTIIEVNIGNPTNFALDDNTIFIPIVPAWYEVLSFEYSTDGTTWKVFRTLAAKSDGTPTAKVGRNTKIRGMVMNTAATVAVNSTTTNDLSAKIATAVSGKTIDVVVNNSGVLATSDLEAGYTLFLPQLASNLTLNLAAANDFGTHALLIKDVEGADNSNYTVTINFNSFAGSSKEIEVNTKANMVVTGDFSSMPAATAGDAITVSNAKSITLGDATSFATAAATTKVTVNKGDVTVNNIDKGAGTGLALINKASTANTVTINSADVTVTDTKASEMNINATSTVETAAATININAAATDQVALTLNKGVTAINLKGGIISNVIAGATAFTSGSKIAVTSSGKSAITCVPTVANVTFSYTSSYDGSADGDAAPMNNFIATASEIAAGTYKYVNETNIASKTTPIYTAAQLAAIGDATTGSGKAADATAFVLLTEITELKGWTPVALNKNFYGQAKDIKKIDAPLFGAVSNAMIDGVKISNADITTTVATGTGVLANTTAGTVIITGTEVKGTISAKSHAGGLVGIAGGTTTFGSTVADTKAKDKVTSNVTFTNSTVYGNVTSNPSAGTFGQFIGQVGNTASAVINVECTATGAFDNSKSGLKFSYNRAISGYEIIGYFKGNSPLVGYSPNATSIKYGTKLGTETALTLTDFNTAATNRVVPINEEETCTYTFGIDGSAADAIDKSGVIVGTTTKTATIYHNSFVGEEY